MNYNLFNLRKKTKKIWKTKNTQIFFEYLSLSFEYGYQTFWVFGFGLEYWVYTQYSNPNAWVFWVHMSGHVVKGDKILLSLGIEIIGVDCVFSESEG